MTSVISLRDMILQGNEEFARSCIETFSCEKIDEDGNKKNLNPNVERFLKTNAIQFAKMKTAITYLIFDSNDNAVLGYFSLTHKSVDIPSGLSRKIIDKIKRFSGLNKENNTYTVSAFLLAQLSKNYAVDNGKRISGTAIMTAAKEKLLDAQNLIGGTIVYLDCEPISDLIHFYENEKFVFFGERSSEIDGKKYLQYLAFV